MRHNQATSLVCVTLADTFLLQLDNPRPVDKHILKKVIYFSLFIYYTEFMSLLKSLLRCCLAALFFLFPLTVYAVDTVVHESFDDATGIATLYGTRVEGGQLLLSGDGVEITEDFNSYTDGALPPNWETYANDATANWVTESNTLSYTTNDYDEGTIFMSGDTVKNVAIQADLNIIGGEQIGGIVFRAVDALNYYAVIYSTY